MEYAIAIMGGLIGGFMNTVASSGTAVTLPLLMFMGLPPAVANATNRLPVVLGVLIASITFIRSGVLNWRLGIKVVIPCSVGSVIGAIIVDHIPASLVEFLIVIAVLMALVLLLSNFKKAFERPIDSTVRYGWKEALYLFLAGLWIGLIVLDGGTYLLLTLMLAMQLPLLKANAYKNIASVVTSGSSLAVMAWDGLVNWEIGGIMAIGSIAGGYVGAKFSMHELAKKWTYRLLVLIICLELIHIVLGKWFGMGLGF